MTNFPLIHHWIKGNSLNQPKVGDLMIYVYQDFKRKDFIKSQVKYPSDQFRLIKSLNIDNIDKRLYVAVIDEVQIKIFETASQLMNAVVELPKCTMILHII